MSQTETTTETSDRTITIIPHHIHKFAPSRRFHTSAKNNVSALREQLGGAQNHSGSVIIGLDAGQLPSGPVTLGEIIPAGYDQVHLILQGPAPDSPVLDVDELVTGGMDDVVRSLKTEVARLQCDAKLRDEENVKFRAEILGIMEEKIGQERRLREHADLKLQELQEMETLHRQAKDCLVANALVHQDPTLLGQIFFEDLLSRTQAELAKSAGMAQVNGEYLFAWRKALDEVGENTVRRREHARTVLVPTDLSGTLIASDEAMDLLCMKDINIQIGGNHIKKPTSNDIVSNLGVLREVVNYLPVGPVKKGINDIIKFDFAIHLRN